MKAFGRKKAMEYILNFYNSFVSLMKTFNAADVLDVAIVSFIIYNIVKLVRETRAGQLVKGILVLVLVYIFSYQLNLRMISTLLSNFSQFTMFLLLIVFQPELRKALEQIGRSKWGNYWFLNSSIKDTEDYINKEKNVIRVITDSAIVLQKSKTGALIIFERKTRLGDIIDTGTLIKAIPSVALVGNIFFNKSPLHDGAMIIRNGEIYAAGCILPLTSNDDVNGDIGTRHRAALGMSENSDAVAIVVSEETGTISIAVNGVLTRDYNRESLQERLEDLILPNQEDIREKRQILQSLKKVNKDDKV